jgi:hypothetical protein
MRRLQNTFDLAPHQAAGLVGNLGHETGGFKHMQELKPLGGAGGRGYAQWTGPRRGEFERWSRAKGLDPNSHDANVGFLEYELGAGTDVPGVQRGKYAGVLNQLKKTENIEQATKLIHEKYETPADVIPSLAAKHGIRPYQSAADRLRYARQAHQLGAAPDRKELDQQMAREVSHKVEGSGKLTVDVNAPAGTKVAAEGQGLFKKVETNRQTQMAPAAEGPIAV